MKEKLWNILRDPFKRDKKGFYKYLAALFDGEGTIRIKNMKIEKEQDKICKEFSFLNRKGPR